MAKKIRATRPRKTAAATGRTRRAVARAPAPRARKARRLTAAATTDDQARTIVYVHGIGNKPVETVLRCQWDRSLMGFGLGERSHMAYWCQADRHGPPEPGTCIDEDAFGFRTMRLGGLGGRTIEDAVEQRRPLTCVIDELTDKPQERAALRRLLDEMTSEPSSPGPVRSGARTSRVRAVADIDFLNPIPRLVTSLFLKDVNDFFFDPVRRKAMKDRLRERLEADNGPFVVVAHSQGSMIAWSLLHDLGAWVDVAQFITIGSPLGLAEVRNQLRRLHGLGSAKLPTPAGVRAWVNVFDPHDVLAQKSPLAQHLIGDASLTELELTNPDCRIDAHSASGYLKLPAVQSAVRASVNLERFQRLSSFSMAENVSTDFERAPRGDRRPLLIELTDPKWARSKVGSASPEITSSLPTNHAGMADRVVELLTYVTGLKSDDPALAIQRLARYVSVWLTQAEAQRLSSRDELAKLGLILPPLYRIWRNSKKVALINRTLHTMQASAAHRSYDATGLGVEWAVLDSGCSEHPHFRTFDTIAARWDCTKVSDAPVRHGEKARTGKGDTTDRYGHGTHVAGIIAGSFRLEGPRAFGYHGMAPHARLHIYKVLDDQGAGDDSWIIKALDHIGSVNEAAGGAQIAGVNLSLGGEFEQDMFFCGHTPLCDELRRLWRQGVIVVVAAGNEGFRRLMTSSGEFDANMLCSVGDPANLEDAIAVGSVHGEKPRTYGVSHFSSRGPTADGRNKPDCVAPGEQILSCRHDPREARDRKPLTREDLYYKLDGTSMAAPHVSGILACFLSRRSDFVGKPDQVKELLIASCTDLGRSRDMQGAGLPNLMKMLVQT